MSKQTGKVEGADGSLIPTEPGLWFDAAQRLNEAIQGIAEMQGAKDRLGYEAGWTRFVDSIEEFWTSFFDEGKKSFKSFQPWAGTCISLRKSDDLLSYIYQSRHKSQHERLALGWTESKIEVAPDYFGTIRNLKINKDGSFEVDAHPTSNKESNKVMIKQHYGDPYFPTISNRGVEFSTPISFNEESLEGKLPHEAAQLAAAFYKSTLITAFEKFDAGGT